MATRRDTLAWLMRALALGGALPGVAFGQAGDPSSQIPPAAGYGRDPDLLRPARPWPLTLNAGQTATVARLADILLPADDQGPSASALGVPGFVDEWISAPYPEQVADRPVVIDGLLALDHTAGARFATVDDARAIRVVEGLCDLRAARDGRGALFFTRFRRICLIGYYTTPEGNAAIGFAGAQPSARFDDPPAEVLARLRVP